MKNYLLALLFAFCLIGCSKDGAQTDDNNSPFDKYKQQFIDGLWKQSPEWATSVGYHKYDSVLVVPNDASRSEMEAFVKSQQAQLAMFDITKQTPLNQIDYHLIQNQLQSTLWQIDTLKSFEWDPSSYNVIGSFAFILNEHYAPLATRLKSFYQKMEHIPAYYEEAKRQIKNPVVELTNLAIEQHLGGVSVIEKDFGDSLKKNKHSGGRAKVNACPGKNLYNGYQ